MARCRQMGLALHMHPLLKSVIEASAGMSLCRLPSLQPLMAPRDFIEVRVGGDHRPLPLNGLPRPGHGCGCGGVDRRVFAGVWELLTRAMCEHEGVVEVKRASEWGEAGAALTSSTMRRIRIGGRQPLDVLQVELIEAPLTRSRRWTAYTRTHTRRLTSFLWSAASSHRST